MSLRMAAGLLILALAGCGQITGPMDSARERQLLTVRPGDEVLSLTLPAKSSVPAGTATLKRVGVNGSVETWISQDRLTISLDQGVVVATRGFGFDLMGSDAGPVLEALAAPSGDLHRRHMRYLTSDNRSVWLRAGCRVTARGHDDSVGLRRFEENCEATIARFTNLYWTDASGRILRSRQWIGPEIGSLDLERHFIPESALEPDASGKRIEMQAPR